MPSEPIDRPICHRLIRHYLKDVALPSWRGILQLMKHRPDDLWEAIDKAYDSSPLGARRIASRIARREIGSSERLGRLRWVIDRTLS
jgi:hypothetical protein